MFLSLANSMFAADWSIFSWLNLHPGYNHIVMVSLATLFIVALSLRIHRAYQNAGDSLVPEARISLPNIAELLVEALYKLFRGLLGDRTAQYFPFLATIFVFILINNLMGSIPGLLPATASVNTNLGVALLVFIYYNIEGWREHGAGYLKQFTGPVIWLAPLMIIIEFVSHLSRPLSLTLRLFGNINGDHMVLGIFSELTPLFVPILFFGLGLFVAFVQAFVFTLLSSIYISLAISHDH
jgi:F-type H+-transporting ATPase subunit a